MQSIAISTCYAQSAAMLRKMCSASSSIARVPQRHGRALAMLSSDNKLILGGALKRFNQHNLNAHVSLFAPTSTLCSIRYDHRREIFPCASSKGTLAIHSLASSRTGFSFVSGVGLVERVEIGNRMSRVALNDELKVCFASSTSSPTSGDDDEGTNDKQKKKATGTHLHETSSAHKPSTTSDTNSAAGGRKTTTPMDTKAASSIISQLSSPPNLLTLSRIVATPFLSYLILVPDQRTYAVIGFLAAGFTDWLDGHLAKNYGMETVLGTYLDPFADKFLVNTLATSLWYVGSLPGPLVALWLARDVAIIGSVYFMVRNQTSNRKMTHPRRGCDKGGITGDIEKEESHDEKEEHIAVMDPRRTPLKVQASFLSKVNTTLQIGLIALGISGDLIGVHEEVITTLCWVTAGTTIFSSVGYLDGSAMKKSGN